MRRRDGFASFSYRPPLALALALLAALAVAAMPGQTAVRLTLKLDAVTLHEALQRLQNHYGWELRGADGSGRSGFLPPTSAQRASFQAWAGR